MNDRKKFFCIIFKTKIENACFKILAFALLTAPAKSFLQQSNKLVGYFSSMILFSFLLFLDSTDSLTTPRKQMLTGFVLLCTVGGCQRSHRSPRRPCMEYPTGQISMCLSWLMKKILKNRFKRYCLLMTRKWEWWPKRGLFTILKA